MARTAPFTQRVGSGLPNMIIDGEVPESARIGLINVLASLVDKGYVRDWGELATASLYAERRLKEEFPNCGYDDICNAIIREMEWGRFYIFCERVYTVL
ncbi:MAG: hypothetical protein ACOX87_12640 [Chloroflexota bacterium]|jgi:hypothetical protein